MAKQKQTTRYAFGNFRFYADCPDNKCGKRYESDNLADIPAECCGMPLMVNDQKRAFSRPKWKLEATC